MMTHLDAAARRLEQACAACLTVAQAPTTRVAELQPMAERATVALEIYETLLRPYMEAALAFFRFREEARQCCSWDHPAAPLAQTYNALRTRYWEANGVLMNFYLHLTGDDSVW
jgi:hypothetical protein